MHPEAGGTVSLEAELDGEQRVGLEGQAEQI